MKEGKGRDRAGRFKSLGGAENAVLGVLRVNFLCGRSVRCFVLQKRFVILSAIEDADDRNGGVVDPEGNDGPLSVIRDAQPGSDIVTHGAAQRKGAEAFAVADDGFRVSRRRYGRGSLGNVKIE